VPAALTGLVGIKPTNGVVARETFPAWIDLSTDGPMATTVADLALLLEVIAGPAVGDPIAQQAWCLGEWRRPSRVYAARRIAGDHPLDPAVETMFDRALAAIESDLRQPVERVDPGRIFPSGVEPLAWFPVGGPEHAHAIGRDTIETRGHLMDPGLRRWLLEGFEVSMADHQAGRALRHRYSGELEAFLAGDAVLVTPMLAVPGWSPEGVLPGASEPGLPLWVFNTEHMNLTGHPAMALPAGQFADGPAAGLPFGIQVIGPRFREALLFGFAAAWEEAHPWPLVAPGYRVFGT
jgi:amidase/aspartyl-tRNA(Asn)/glutamyl-tRNA(Gln) amidotransferase subunit A